MKRINFGLGAVSIGIVALSLLSSCSNRKANSISDKTGWAYNDKNLGGFEVRPYEGQITGPGLRFIQGGRFTMGQTDDEVVQYRNNIPRTVSVSSFYMDETEVANVHYREYTYWLERAYGSDYPELVAKAYPDSTAWREALSYNEAHVQYYFRHAAYNFYPVVGVTWHQAKLYCEWRSHRVNEMILIEKQMLKKDPNQVNENVFNTESYVKDQYIGLPGKNQKRDLDPTGTDKRNVDYSDGLLLPNYRLPTEAEWEYAARAEISENPEPRNKRRRGEEALVNRKGYPWGNPRSMRNSGKGDANGMYYANYQRAGNDFAGVPGGQNDNSVRTAPVLSYYPNAFGLYNMAGNVSEWTLDTYRPGSHQEVNGYDPFQGNEYYKILMEETETAEKDSIGGLTYIPIDSTDIKGKYNRDYKSHDVRNAKDDAPGTGFAYDYGVSSIYNNETKVIKGGSWADRSYWLSPGTRRPMQADHSSAKVGFRCVMDRLGSMGGNDDPGGLRYKPIKKR